MTTKRTKRTSTSRSRRKVGTARAINAVAKVSKEGEHIYIFKADALAKEPRGRTAVIAEEMKKQGTFSVSSLHQHLPKDIERIHVYDVAWWYKQRGVVEQVS